MKIVFLAISLTASAKLTQAVERLTFHTWAQKPPTGWNSWDCYGAGVWESNVTANVAYMPQNLNIVWSEPTLITAGGTQKLTELKWVSASSSRCFHERICSGDQRSRGRSLSARRG